MTDLRQAAQAVIDSWDSPLWNNGSTADAIAALRIALEEAEQRRAEFSEATQRNKDHAEWYLKTQQQQAEPDRWVIEKVGDKLLLNGKEIDPGTIEVRLDGLTYRSSEKMEVRQQAEPVQEPFDGLATELFVVAQRSPADDGFSDTIDRIESWLREHFSTPPQHQAEPVDQQLAKLAQHCTMLEQKLALTEQQAPKRQAELRLSSEEIQQVLAAASVPEGMRTPEMEDCLQRCRDLATGTIKIQEWEDAKTVSMVPVIPAESITDAMMNLVDRLGSEWKQVDLRAWQHLFVYAPQRKPLTDEQDRALCEAYCNDASDEYFKARPALDFPAMRRIFYAGHRKAWISYEAAHSIKEANNAN